MDIRQLQYFCEVAKHSSFTKAASALHITQPSLSKAIKNLEEELGVPLFYRSPRKIALTDAGHAVLHNSKHVLEAFQGLTSELTDIMELKKGEIRIGIPPIIGAVFFSKLISQYISQFSYIDLKLTEVGTVKIKEGVNDGTLDIGLVCHLPENNAGLDSMHVVTDPLKVVVSTKHRLANTNRISFADLREEAFILYTKDFSLHDLIVQECVKNGYYPNIVCESSQKEFMIEMVDTNLGIALLPSKICTDIRGDSIISLSLENDLKLELGMIWKKDKYLSHAVREFISLTSSSSH